MVSKVTEEIDVAIVGSGILGLLVAAQAARANRKVLVFAGREMQGTIPPRDSQRNHKWLQSGLLYAPDLGIPFAMSMWDSGVKLLEYVAMNRPPGTGIFRFATNGDDADQFAELAKKCRLDHQTQVMRDSDARNLLGPLYGDNYRYYRVPDVPFPEQELMERLCKRARAAGTQFVIDNVRLERTTNGGVKILTGDRSFLPDTTVLCAGCGTVELLGQLGVVAPIKVFRSPLLRLYGAASLGSASQVRADLLVDRTTGLAVVKSRLRDSQQPCLIVGDRARLELTGNEAHRREVTSKERRDLMNLLPPTMQTWFTDVGTTAGHKTEIIDDSGNPSVRPWVYRFDCDGLSRLIAALPGKATLAFQVAKTVMDFFPESGGSASPNAPAVDGPEPDFRHHIEFRNIDENKE